MLSLTKTRIWAFAPVLFVRQTFNHGKNTDVVIIQETVGDCTMDFLSDREQGTASSISSEVNSSSPSDQSNRSRHLLSTFVSFLIRLHNESFCLTSLLNGSYPAITGMFQSEVYVSSICQYYAHVQAIKFNCVWTERTGRLLRVQPHVVKGQQLWAGLQSLQRVHKGKRDNCKKEKTGRYSSLLHDRKHLRCFFHHVGQM